MSEHPISLLFYYKSRTGRSTFAVLSNWHQCAHPVCSCCQCCWGTWHSDLLAICPYPDAVHGRNLGRCLGFFLWAPNIHPQPARIRAQLNLTQPVAIERCFVLCCQNALVVFSDWLLMMPQEKALLWESQWWFLTRFGKSHVDERNYTDVITWVNKHGISLNWEIGSVFLLE